MEDSTDKMMASNALEEKMKKIRLQNEKIQQRYEEVEADKKNAAKLNALVQLVPSDDWPERKEPPEFLTPPKNTQKQKPSKEHNDRQPSQHYSGVQERLSKKDHKFTQGNGPPPDPKYNFLADSERETRVGEDGKNEDDKNRSKNKTPRGPQKRRSGNCSSGLNQPFFKDNRGPHAFHSKGESLPEYEAWRAERDRIDEARINRQKTAEGNWRREWDCNKVNIEKESESLRQGDSNRKEFDKKNNHFENDYSNRGHSSSRTYHGSQKNHGNQEHRRPHHEHNQSHEYKRQDNKQAFAPVDDRMATATDKNIKVTMNPANQGKGPLMSVKVSSPSIAGTGRVGPRQKSRITYCSQSDADMTSHELSDFSRQKSFDEKSSGANFTSGQQKSTPKSPFSQRKKEGNPKSPYPQKKEFRGDDQTARPKNLVKTSNAPRNEHRDQRLYNQHIPKLQRGQKRGAQKTMAETTKSVTSSSDNAIPSEYDPKKSFDSENSNKQSINNENKDIENVFNKSNQSNVVLCEEPKTLLDEPNTCNDENSNVQNEQNIKSGENNKNDKDIKNGSNTIEIENITKNVKEINICEEEKLIKTNQDNTCQNLIDEDIDKNETESNVPSNIIQNKKKEKHQEILHESEQNESKLPETVKDQNISTEKKLILSNEKLTSSSIQLENQAQLLNVINKSKKIEELINASEEITNDESQQLINNSKNSSEAKKIENLIENKCIESLEKETAIPEVFQNTSLNDSGIVDVGSELDKDIISKLGDSQIFSANDSGLADDFSKTQNNIDFSITEIDIKKDIQNGSQIQSDLVDVTKENCEKLAEICDNTSIVSETIAQADNDQVNKDDNEPVDKPTENPTKDNDIEIVKADDENLISNTLKNELISDETAEKKESSTIAAEESKTD